MFLADSPAHGFDASSMHRCSAAPAEIKISKFIDGKYVKNYFKDDIQELSLAAHKLINGFNDNEVIIVPKNVENVGFFERFFNLFS